jgi:hypothetical protein
MATHSSEYARPGNQTKIKANQTKSNQIRPNQTTSPLFFSAILPGPMVKIKVN